MTDKEREKYEEYLSKATSVFEFGCGGTTILTASFANISSIHSVDSVLNWINKVDKNLNVGREKVTFHHIDINAYENQWGEPKDDSKLEFWPDYSSALKICWEARCDIDRTEI